MPVEIKSCFQPPPMCWELNYDPQSSVGIEIDYLMQEPEPEFWSQSSLYELSNGSAQDFFDVEYGLCSQPFITFTSIFKKLTKEQRKIVLANFLEVFKMCRGMIADQQTLFYIKSSFSARLHALMQMERHIGDFGQHEGIEQ